MTDPAPKPSLHYLALVTEHQRTLYGVLWTLLRNRHDVDDVLQEVNAVLWAKAGDFDMSRPFMPWAMRIAELQVMAFRKRRNRVQRATSDSELVAVLARDWLADEAIARPDRRLEALHGCLQKLPVAHRQMILLRYEEGSSVNAMAAEQGRSPKALSESLRRIRAKLLECIERTLALEGTA
jgi:RNA polymerase sigma-70 factor (ECF subfamily)